MTTAALDVPPPTLPTPRAVARPGRPRSATLRHLRERGIVTALLLCGGFSLLTTVAIVYTLGSEALVFFRGAPGKFEGVPVTEFLGTLKWSPLLGAEKHFGVWPLICGTLMITLVALSVAAPLGLVTAIWLSEYAPRKVRAILKPLLEVLAGIPTVVLGFFALTIITPALQFAFIQRPALGQDGSPILSGDGTPVMAAWNPLGIDGYNVLSAGIAVGILVLPIIVSLAEDALRAVPRSLREASFGLGATRLETSLRVVFPAGLSGIVAAFLLAIARCIGETMIVGLAAGNGVVALQDILGNGPLRDRALIPFDVTASMQPMTGYLVQIFLGDVSNLGIEYYSSYAVAALLFVMTFALTVLGHLVRVRFQQQYD